jgi:hypothetical protein
MLVSIKVHSKKKGRFIRSGSQKRVIAIQTWQAGFRPGDYPKSRMRSGRERWIEMTPGIS